MREWFEGLQSREQVAVSAAAVLVVFAIAWFAIWKPLGNSQGALTQSVVNWERAVAELGPLKSALAASNGNTTVPAAGAQSLVVIVDSTVSRYNLSTALQRSQPSGQSGIRVEFENAAFDDLVRWMGILNSNYGLQVQSGSFSVATQSVPGRVNASVTLER